MNALLFAAAAAMCCGVFAQFERERQPRDETLQECFSKVADVFFILDSSSSIYVEEYQQELSFVNHVVNRLNIDPDYTRVGALTFSDDYQVGFDLTRFRSKNEIVSSLDERNLPYRTGVTNTDKAIRYVRENVGFRNDITKVIVVITDGGSRAPGLTKREADLARDAGFHMVVVGIGSYLDEQEWRNIASDPNNDYVFNITNFNALEALKDALPRRICLYPPIIIGSECTVSETADLFFVAGPDGYDDALDLVAGLADDFVDNRDRLQVQYFMDGCRAETDVGFQGPTSGVNPVCNRFADRAENAEDTYTNLLTRMRNAAESMRASRSTNQVAVIFLDDASMRNNRFGILQEVRSSAQREGIRIVAVDLGVRDYLNFVLGMTSEREDVITFTGQTLNQAARKVLGRVCPVVNERDFGRGFTSK